jgi:hypothetical protein
VADFVTDSWFVLLRALLIVVPPNCFTVGAAVDGHGAEKNIIKTTAKNSLVKYNTTLLYLLYYIIKTQPEQTA